MWDGPSAHVSYLCYVLSAAVLAERLAAAGSGGQSANIMSPGANVNVTRTSFSKSRLQCC